MPTRNIHLTGHDDRFVHDQIAAGRYKDASEVLRAGLRLLEQQAREDEVKLAALRGLAAEAFEALDRGEGTTREGDQQLADFIRTIGRRAAKRTARSPAGN
jgi:antitoxin ParD1/3/4